MSEFALNRFAGKGQNADTEAARETETRSLEKEWEAFIFKALVARHASRAQLSLVAR